MTTRDPHDVVRLARASNPVQAHVWEQALQSEGISCKVVGDFLEAGIGNISGMEPELWVHREDLAAAEEILKRGEHPADGEKEDTSEPSK